jgi:caffeoyl-CoA O-methyltransferase
MSLSPMMLRASIASGLLLSFTIAMPAPGQPRSTAARPAAAPASGLSPSQVSGVPADVAAILAEIRARDSGQLAISEEDGRFLRVLIAASATRRALEIGGASGYSAIWMGLALRETGGRLITLEYDPGRARELEANIKRAGLSDVVQVMSGDAFKLLPGVSGSFDFVFLDAWKKDYKRFLDLVLPKLDPGGLFVAHNVVNKRSEMGDFLDAIQRSPMLLTTIVSPAGEGMSVSYKRQPAKSTSRH